jgi:hypothetical protein
MRRVVAYTTLALGLTVGGSAYAGGTPSDYEQCPSLDQKVNTVVQQMKANNVKFDTKPNYLTDKVKMNGKLNVDGQYIDDAAFQGRTYNPRPQSGTNHEANIFLNNANLMTEVDVNKFTTVNVDLAYLKDSVVRQSITNGVLSTSAFNEDADLSVDEAYVTLHHFTDCYPVIFKAGRYYNSFGTNENPYPMLYSPVQLLTQQRTTNAELGFGMNGFYGQVFAARGSQSSNDDGEFKLDNWGAKLGAQKVFPVQGDNLAVNASASYIQDYRDADFFGDSTVAVNNSKLHEEPAAAVHVDATYGPFGLQSNYASTLDDYSQQIDDSELWGADVHGDYKFRLFNLKHQIGAGYQVSGNFQSYNNGTGFAQNPSNERPAANVPKYRVTGDFTTHFNNNVKGTLMYAHTEGYSGQGRNGGDANRVIGRLGVEL